MYPWEGALGSDRMRGYNLLQTPDHLAAEWNEIEHIERTKGLSDNSDNRYVTTAVLRWSQSLLQHDSIQKKGMSVWFGVLLQKK